MNSKLSAIVLFLLLAVGIVAVILTFVSLGFTSPVPWVLLAIVISLPLLNSRNVKKQYIYWSDDFSVGVEEIDNDHRKLINIINESTTIMLFDENRHNLVDVINKLLDYTEYHFKHEEKLMQEYDYADAKEHKEYHKEMIQKVEYFKELNKTKDYEDAAKEIIAYLKDWLINYHIAKCDKDLGKFLASKGVK